DEFQSASVSLPCAQLCASRSRISTDFFVAGCNDFLGEYPPGNGGCTGLVLHKAGFKRMERDYDHTAARTHHSDRRIEKRFQALQLIINVDPQSLKCARRRMNLAVPRPTRHPLNGAHQISGALQWTRADDRSGNRT